jgi:hypothetical protein
MWPVTFDNRLQAWVELRSRCQLLDLENSLTAINQWWFNTPWQPYYLHWDDQADWPDPWQLLSDNVYCDLARSLGILYTISLLERADMADAELVLADDGTNLVLVAKEKYILNWNKDSIVNNKPKVKTTRRFKKTQVT